MMLRLPITLVLICGLLSGLLAGCGQVSVFGRTIGEKPPAADVNADPTVTSVVASPTSVQAPQVQRVKLVALVLTPQAAMKVVDDLRFNADTLLIAIKRELQLRKLLDDTNPHARAVEISLDDYAMRPTSNAIVFGNIISTGTLSGNIRLRDEQGNDLPNRRIEAQARVSIPASGVSTNPLGPLYSQFAAMLADSLDGTPAKPIMGADQHPR